MREMGLVQICRRNFLCLHGKTKDFDESRDLNPC